MLFTRDKHMLKVLCNDFFKKLYVHFKMLNINYNHEQLGQSDSVSKNRFIFGRIFFGNLFCSSV